MKVLVLGASKHQGEFEGNKFDFSKLYVVAEREQSEISRGSSGVDLRAIPEVFDIAKNFDYTRPVFCEVDTALRALGGGNSRETVINIKQVTVSK